MSLYLRVMDDSFNGCRLLCLIRRLGLGMPAFFFNLLSLIVYLVAF